jgi:hypothetical protein
LVPTFDKLWFRFRNKAKKRLTGQQRVEQVRGPDCPAEQGRVSRPQHMEYLRLDFKTLRIFSTFLCPESEMALATLVAISGPKKVSISGPTPSNTPRYGLLPHPNPYVPPYIKNRYIKSYNCSRSIKSHYCRWLKKSL